jgi:hypothetical protein
MKNIVLPDLDKIFKYEYIDESGQKFIGFYKVTCYKTVEGGFINIHCTGLNADIHINNDMYKKIIDGNEKEIYDYLKIANDEWREKGII